MTPVIYIPGDSGALALGALLAALLSTPFLARKETR